MNEDDIELIHSNEPKEPCWPFWGALSEKPKKIFSDVALVSFHLPNAYIDVFDKFRTIADKCLRILERRTLTELKSAATAIQAEIEEAQIYYVKEETEQYIEDILKNGGWELGYLPDGSKGTKFEVKDLLLNWSREWDDTPNLPNPEDLSRLDALLNYGEFQWNHQDNPFFQLGLVEPEPWEAYSVLALIVICEAVNKNQQPTPNNQTLPLTTSQVTEIGIATIEAIEISNTADFFKSLDLHHTANMAEIDSKTKSEIKRHSTARATNAAKIRFKKNNEARAWVQTEWQKNKDGYDGNKSEFSRAYSSLVKREFTNKYGEPLSITDKTICEIWLRDTPNASK